VALCIHIIFVGYLFKWSRQLNNQYIYPLEVTSKATLENDKHRKSSLTESI
jgi:uncharacterized membrane protein